MQDLDAFTILEFCRRHQMSPAHYYRLPPEQRPREFSIGHHKRITREDAAEWRELVASGKIVLTPKRYNAEAAA
jgi:hypothetical protein